MSANRAVRFWDRVAERYARTPIRDEAAYQEKLRITRTCFRPDMEVLEFGCGTGSTALLHAPHVHHIRAVDCSSKMIQIAQGKADAAGVNNVTFEQGTIEDLEAGDQSFDAVLGLSILHLLDDKEAAIARVHRMLKPGGVFVSSTACIAEKMKFFKWIAPIGQFLRLIPPVQVFSRRELMDSLTAAGFTIDHEWHPGNGMTAFIIARKPA